MQENNELPTYSPEEVEQLIAMTEDLQTENEQQREELRKLNRQIQTFSSDNQRLSAELRAAIQNMKKLKQAEAEKQQLQRSLQEQSKLMKQLCESSDSEMPKKLNVKLNEQEKLLLKEKEKNEKLKKQLQDTAVSAEEDKKASNRRISRLIDEISQLERKLESNRFDKEQCLKSLEMRERAVVKKRFELDEHIRVRAEAIEKDTVAHYKVAEEALEAEKAKCIEQQKSVEAERQEWLLSEKEKIDNEVEQRIIAHKSALDEQNAKERAEQEKEYKAKKKALKAKYMSISGATVLGGFICATVAVCSAVISFVHGLLPFMIADSKEIGKWISSDWHSIFGKAPAFPKPAFPILSVLQLALPLIFLIAVGIWTTLDFDERKWVVFADKISCIAIGISVGISAVFGKQLSWIGLNTLMFPLAIYLFYVLIRWLWEIDAFDAAERLLTSAADKWSGLEKNEKQGYALLVVVIVAAVVMFRFWW